MKQDKETKNKLLVSAREEFREKGYLKASLRNICKKAGVTTGALYFFFEDKEDLFDAVVGETVNDIWQIMSSHFQDERDMAEDGRLNIFPKEDVQEDFATAGAVIHRMYLHREDVLLLLTKSQGTKYENIADRFIETSEIHYRKMADVMQRAYPDKRMDDKFVHWLAHEQIDAFIYMITHIEDEKEAVEFITQAITYMMAGWYGVFMGNAPGAGQRIDLESLKKSKG